MSQDATFVDALVRTVREPRILDGTTFIAFPAGWSVKDTREPDPSPDQLELSTLSGLVAYLSANVDGVLKEQSMLHVMSPTDVALFSKTSGRFYVRNQYALARCADLVGTANGFGHYSDRESFNIWLQTCFTDGEDRARVLALVGNIREEAIRNTSDDGVTQNVTAKTGIALAKDVAVPNPVKLRPYRTFREIAQPASSFVLRMRQSPNGAAVQCALFEADGNGWKLEAMSAIADYLKANASGVAVIC